jgi:hypothetical protein
MTAANAGKSMKNGLNQGILKALVNRLDTLQQSSNPCHREICKKHVNFYLPENAGKK